MIKLKSIACEFLTFLQHVCLTYVTLLTRHLLHFLIFIRLAVVLLKSTLPPISHYNLTPCSPCFSTCISPSGDADDRNIARSLRAYVRSLCSRLLVQCDPTNRGGGLRTRVYHYFGYTSYSIRRILLYGIRIFCSFWNNMEFYLRSSSHSIETFLSINKLEFTTIETFLSINNLLQMPKK